MFAKFEESSKALKSVMKSHLVIKTGLGFSKNAPSTSKTKQVVFVKPRREL